MTFPLARLVAAPDPSATVRYDFNDEDALAGRGVFADGFSLGAPQLLSASDAVSPLYGDRRLSFRHEIMGSRSDALSALAVLSRELLRPANWFMFQLGGVDTRPTFWRLRATGPEALSFDRWYVDPPSGDPVPSRESSNAFEIDVALTAEAFGYGERITLGPYMVVQDAVGDNPMRVALPTIKGDAPAALRVSVTPEGSTTAQGDSAWMVGCTSGTAAVSDFVLTSFGAIAGDVTTDADADWFGGTALVIPLDAGTPNLERRFFVNIPYTVPMGRYNVEVRCTPAGGADQTLLFQGERWRNQASNDPAPMRVVAHETVASDDYRHFWVDLGDTTVPFGSAPPVDGGGMAGPTTLAVLIGTGDGSASAVNIDAVRLIPVGGDEVIRTTVLQSTFGILGLGSGLTGVFDGDLESYWVYDSAQYYEQSPVMMGGFPTADPAAVKNLLLVTAVDNGDEANTGAADYITNRGAESEVTVSYHPRLLHLDGRP